ncbi:MAG TPA: S8 family serine peptidase, partial [Candidatus Micrarchaeota archaeon]|nr:S8 family serine peptidase [Candidatus Micrarchaeota archaeon]
MSSEISRSGNAPVIVLLKDTTPLSSPALSEADRNSLMAAKRNVYAAAQNRLILSKKLKSVKRQYTSFNGFAANVDPSELSSLASDPSVEGVYYDRIFYGTDAAAWPLINVTPAYSIQVNGINSTGSGKTVCILDTGVNYTLPDFGGCPNAAAFAAGTCPKFVGGYDFVNSDTDPMDDNNHGTHISGIVNRTAPGVRIAMVKVLDSGNTGTLSNILSGIDWCNNNRAAYNISAISMSISDNGQYATGACPNYGLTASLDSAKSNGIFIAAASGNNHFSAGVSSPACENSVYSVGAVYASNVGSAAWSACTDSNTQADQVACFTNYGDNLDILAPGAIITSTNRNGGTLDMGGTSQAVPFVTATVALVQSELAAQGQSLTPDQLYQRLNQSGKRITIGSYSVPRLNAYAFLQAADTFPAVANYSQGTPSDGATYYNAAMLNISFSMNKNLFPNSVNFEWNGTNTTVPLQNNSGPYPRSPASARRSSRRCST